MEDLTIGQRIAAKRKELGLSQIELGEHMGVSRQSVSKWEADGALPEIDKLIALSKLFHVSVGWLLGVEEQEAPEQPPEQTFTQREWEIIDRLTQEKPALPKWLLPLISGVAALSLIAAFLSGGALYAGRSRSRELASISQSVANLTTSLGVGLSDTTLLETYSFQAQPSANLEECTFRFTGIPVFHEPGSTAKLFLVLGGQAMAELECAWNGSCYSAEFTLPAYNGYSATFCLTGSNGIVCTSRLHDELLSSLMDQRDFDTVAVAFGSRGYNGSELIFDEMQVTIDAPGILRDCTDLWAQCDLVVLGDGRELGRLDLLNRSPYSRQVNFGGVDVDFFTKNQSVAIGDITGIRNLEILLYCRLSSGLQLQKTVDSINCSTWW